MILLLVPVKVLIFLFIFLEGKSDFWLEKKNPNMKSINDNDLSFIARNRLFGIFLKKIHEFVTAIFGCNLN